MTSNDNFQKELTRVRSQLIDLDGATARRMEEATRALGELLGFAATRPDNDVGTGPDVLWIDEPSKTCLAFELKTDKDDPATYWKKDIGQGHNHLTWVADNCAGYSCLGLLYVGPDGDLEAKGNPSEAMWRCSPLSLVELRDQLIALINDLRLSLPLERPGKTREFCVDGSWEIGAIFQRLKDKQMRQLPQTHA